MKLTTDSIMHRVSVIIPAYNAAQFIHCALDSALSQTWPHLEVIVVNDGSKDDTLQVLKRYEDRIRVINKENGGLSSARNCGILAATGEFVAFLDADDRWLPEKITRQVEALSADADIGFCSTRTLVESPDRTAVCEWLCPRIDDTLLQTLFLQNGAIPGSGSGVMARSHLLSKVGLFDESLRSLEDIDMWMRLSAITGYACIDEALTVIVKHPDSMSRNLDTMRSSALKVLSKNRNLLSHKVQARIWRAGYATVLADYAKWEYRTGHRIRAMWHLLSGLFRSPFGRGRMISGLLLAMALRRSL